MIKTRGQESTMENLLHPEYKTDIPL